MQALLKSEVKPGMLKSKFLGFSILFPSLEQGILNQLGLSFGGGKEEEQEEINSEWG